MGVDFSYLLYFRREHLWEALQGVAAIAESYQPPTIIRFPDRELAIPLGSWITKEQAVSHDDPEFEFSIVLDFEADEAIQDYIDARDRRGDDTDPGVPDAGRARQVPIGYIYLTVHNDLSRRMTISEPSDLVLFDFGTTGTRMSLLFSNSASIRRTFVVLLETHHGLCGVFNTEYRGELFWLAGRRMSRMIGSAYLTPQDIEGLLSAGSR